MRCPSRVPTCFLPRRRARALLLAPLLFGLALPAAAQPWASESARASGRAAIGAANAGRWTDAAALAVMADPLAAKLVNWMRMQVRGMATAEEIAAFLAANPDWPMRATLLARAEELLPVLPNDALVSQLYGHELPRGLSGAQALADVQQRQGRDPVPGLRRAWRDGPAEAIEEAAFLSRNAAVLTPEDHLARFERLAWTRQFAAAGRLLPLLPAAGQAAASRRLALAGDQPGAEAGLPANPGDLGLAAEWARYLRRKDRDQEAAAVWQAAEPLQRDLTPQAASAVWTERQVLARKLLRLGDAASAWRIAAYHGQPADSAGLHDAEFLAGFIALRKLDDPARAARHFAVLGRDSSSIITRSRASYWRGRAAEAQGRAAEAREHYAEAATLPTGFYGQLAALALGERAPQVSARISGVVPAVPSPAAAAAFLDMELARAVVTLADLGDTGRARTFLLRIEDLAADPATQVLAARLAHSIGRPDHAVWIARRAGIDGVMLLPEGFPAPYPAPATGEAEPAFINAISRQESNFDTTAVSPANARGLMQLLPGTAAQVARQLGVPTQTGWLTSQPLHNIQLGSQYLADQIARFGNLAMAAAAYNAGPRRVDEWVSTYGDPRLGPVAGGADMIDWMEMIPFNETRNYVQRVVENAVIYRALDAGTAGLDHPLKPWLPVGAPLSATAAR
ncbi:lytic transglycosylase domain-containing protein [Roseomonas marmotae]|uniref:Transglycosylase SLT domain-containing protein n=1 Tax=Roseomonas marmotae TaxID=2768161 RepID=A0ABS3KA16_9PROT|nr:lytic transglycosylase domain-containing protein [Roseomonas marmotae]MBO1074308.1 transglycosylase SLT domain-containing protein [Roseomonas marmotae]QTI78061.1 transglycosylase SLT domain-containing protein [Roseomonas marmotae]